MQTKIDSYKNLYWTRVISVDSFDSDDDKKWHMSFDIANEI